MNRLQTERDARDKGFTLIELLVVIIIIGILAAIAIPVFLNQRKKGVDAGVKSDLRSVAEIIEDYTVDHPNYTRFGEVDPPTNATVRDALGRVSVYNYRESSPNNVIVIKGSPADGFCIRGHNPGGTATSGLAAFWYDSKLGGLQPGGPQGALTSGACAVPGTYYSMY